MQFIPSLTERTDIRPGDVGDGGEPFTFGGRLDDFQGGKEIGRGEGDGRELVGSQGGWVGHEEFGDGSLLDVLGQVGKRCIAVVNHHGFYTCAIGFRDLFGTGNGIGTETIAYTAIKDALDGKDTCFGGKSGKVCADVAWGSLGELPEIDVARETQLGAKHLENSIRWDSIRPCISV